MELYMKESGTPNAPTILFLHGAGTSGWMWEAQTDALADYHCVNVDLPGHGKSNHIEWVSMADTADKIAAIIRERGTNGRASLVGLSLGGYVTLYALAKYANSIDCAIMSGVTAVAPPINGLTGLQIRLMQRFMKSAWFVRAQAKMMFMPDDVADLYTESMMAMSRQAFQRILAELYVFKLPDLSGIPVRTLVTAGSKETKTTVESVTAIPKIMPNAQGRLVPGLHHAWNGEDPELFSAMIRAWLTDAPLPDRLQSVG